MAYELIEAEKENFPITLMCQWSELSRSGYYAWRGRGLSPREKENRMLSKRIEAIHQESRGSYGVPRIQASLRAEGRNHGRQRIARLMKQLGIEYRRKKKKRCTTDSNHDNPIAPNLLQRDFSTDEPDLVWVGDITYIQTEEGWLYLAAILDLFSRRVVGWSMANHMGSELVLGALQAALGQRRPSQKGLIFHSDRGSQYASAIYRQALSDASITGSMSRRGNCWDNAVAESFFGSLKDELIRWQTFSTFAQARTTIAEWIEVFYNRKRLHSSIGYLTPVALERRYWTTLESRMTA